MVLVPMLSKVDVRTVTVLELNHNVIRLVEQPLRDYLGCILECKLTVIHDDAFTWQPPRFQKWDCIYLDIWPDICLDNLPEIAKLKRRYARRLNREKPGAWMAEWMERDLRSRAQSERQSRGYARAFGFKCGGMRGSL